MLHTTKTFELGNSIYFECVYRNASSVPTDPTSPSWQITTSGGVVVASSSTEGGPYKRTTGYWYTFWTPDDVGDYVLEFSGTVGSQATKIRRPFKVIKTTNLY